ncbi:streptococcal histidine triad protein [Chlamydia trachomatis]|nr:streptococcal histidine triad protein [Chlamydia trachomatis]
MKKKQLLYSGLILAALASGSALAYQLGVSNGKSSTKPSVQYVKNSSKDADKSETMASDASKKDAKEEGIAAEQIVVKITDEGYVTSHGDHFLCKSKRIASTIRARKSNCRGTSCSSRGKPTSPFSK